MRLFASTRQSRPNFETNPAVDGQDRPLGLKRRILIVEDDPDLWPLLKRYSAQLDPGLVIDLSASSDEATKRLSGSIRYDALVVDFCLPKPGDGYALCARTESVQPWVRFGMISALMGFKPKGVPFLAKPFTPPQYRTFLRELLA